jgi:predicted ATPase
MLISRLELKNWRNFKQVDIQLEKRCYLIGANATGKSNFLDVFRFLRDVCKSTGGGLQQAIASRGGMTRLRCLQARNDSEIRISVDLAESGESAEPTWRYTLAFKADTKKKGQVVLTEERVAHQGKELCSRPDKADDNDPLRLTQTFLEQINNNAPFRPVADCLQDTTYLHLVPQLLKHADELSGRMLEDDPFGQGLLQRIAKTNKKTRDARLRRIQHVLEKAVPHFQALRFEQDEVTGLFHMEACYRHWRPRGAWQREEQLSDGTLRLIGLLWAVQEGDGLLLLEEPELSLNDSVVAQIPLLLDRILRERRVPHRQVFISTHSEKLLSEVLDPLSIVLLEQTEEGTVVRPANPEECQQIRDGLNPAEVLLPKTRPAGVEQLSLFP